MKYTCQIRKYLSMAAAAALLACMLSGCMRANLSSSSQNVSNDSAGQSTVSGGLSQEALAGAGNTSDQGQQSASDAQAQSAAVVEGQTAQNVSGTTTPNAVEDTAQSDAQTTAPEQQADESQLQQQQEVYVESGVQAGSAVEAFTGEFEKSDGGETVVITLMNDNEISFQFSTSGIGSTAQAGGNTAVYYGEDGYSIVFDVAGDTLGVTVNGEGGSQTVMNGIYYRVLEGGNDSDDEGVDDPVIIDEQYDEQ